MKRLLAYYFVKRYFIDEKTFCRIQARNFHKFLTKTKKPLIRGVNINHNEELDENNILSSIILLSDNKPLH